MAETDGLELPVGLTEKQFLRQIARIEARLNKTTNDVERRFRTQNQGISRSFRDLERSSSRSFSAIHSSAVRAAAGIVAFMVSSQRMIRAADNYRQVENRLRAIGETSDEAGEKLLASALRSRTGIEDMSRAVLRFQKATGDSFDTSIRRVETLNKLLAAGGATATEVSSVMLQLGQALTSGTLQGDELRSLRENAPVEVLDALARAAGSTREELKQLGADGELTSDIIKRALDELATTADQKFADVEQTVGSSLINVGSAFTVFIGRMDEGLGASGRLAAGLDKVAQGLADSADEAEAFGTAVVTAMEKAQSAVDDLAAALREAGNAQIFDSLNEWLGVTEGGQLINPDVREAEKKIDLLEGEVDTLQAQIENNTELGFDNTEAIARLREVRAELAAVRAEAANLPRFVAGLKPDGTAVQNLSETGTPISGYTPPPSPVPSTPPPTPSSSGGGSKKSGGSGRKGKAETPFFGDIEKDLIDLQRQIELVGKSNEEVATAKARWELLDEAKKRGIPINDELSAQIEEQAGKFGRLTAELERNETTFDQYERGLERIGETFADIAFEAESFGDVVSGVLKRIAAEMFSSGVQGLIGNLFPAGSTGGNIIGSIFGGFRAGGGPVQSGRSYIVGEEGPELFSPGMNGSILNASQVSAMRGQGEVGNVTFSPSLTIQGSADNKVIARVEAMFERERGRFFSDWMRAQKEFGNRIG